MNPPAPNAPQSDDRRPEAELEPLAIRTVPELRHAATSAIAHLIDKYRRPE